MLCTVYDFTLPQGVVGEDGTLQRHGKMRMATAADEIYPLRDPRVQNNPEYLVIMILSRVIIQLGTVRQVTPELVEGLFVQDLMYLQDLYNRINQADSPAYEGPCPHCGKVVQIPINFQQAGLSSHTPPPA